jgi:hypothetical protein
MNKSVKYFTKISNAIAGIYLAGLFLFITALPESAVKKPMKTASHIVIGARSISIN